MATLETDQLRGIPANPALDPTAAVFNIPPPIANNAAAIPAYVPYTRLGRLLNKPAEYDGKDRAKCNTFVAQIKLFISGNSECFVTVESKLLFAATYLRDRAFTWFQPYMIRANDPILSDFESFCSALLSAFGDPELKKTMMRKIKSLKQTTSASDYRTAFENYAQYLSLGEVALKEYFYDGLKDSIKDTIADILSEFEPTDFDEFKAWCVRIDSRQHDRKIDGKGETRPTFKIRPGFQPNRSSSTHFRAPPKTTFTVRNNGPQSMDLPIAASSHLLLKRRNDDTTTTSVSTAGKMVTAPGNARRKPASGHPRK